MPPIPDAMPDYKSAYDIEPHAGFREAKIEFFRRPARASPSLTRGTGFTTCYAARSSLPRGLSARRCSAALKSARIRATQAVVTLIE
jgi:hypothetical protein